MFHGMSTIPETSGTSALGTPLFAVPSTQTSSLERYLAQIADPVLRENISREIAGMGRTFGLVFERHHPEGIRLPKHRVRRGSKVIINTEKNSGYYRVSRLAKDDGTALLVDDAGNQSIYPIDQLTVAKEFGDVMYPGLRKLSEVRNGAADAPVHTIINGENYHALEALQYTHAGKVDLIYIDPPYNTGNADWKYNDRYVDAKDGYRHSKWLSFMEKRLLTARQLLSKRGVIFLSIGEDENARLKLLCDQVFGPDAFIGNFLWEKTQHFGRQKVNSYSNADNILAYAPGLRNGGVKEVLVEAVKSDFEDAPLFNRSNPVNTLRFPEGTVRFNMPDGIYTKAEDEKYVLEVPVSVSKGVNTSELVLTFRSRWSQSRVDEEVAKGSTFWVKSTKFSIRAVYAGGKESRESPRQIIFTSPGMPGRAKSRYGQTVGVSEQGTGELKAVLGREESFTYPKPVSLISYLISLYFDPETGEHPKDAVILDFFGGSGTTAEAVIRLNSEDGGTRQAILVTNNELSKKDDVRLRKAGHTPGDTEYEALGVFHHVTKPRLETVITGTRPDGSTYSDGLAANAAFFELTYLDEPEIVTGKALNDLAGLFWLKSGGTGGTVEITAGAKADGYAISESGSTAILFSPGRARALAEQLRADGQDITNIFIVTDSEAQGDEAASHFSIGINVERIYGSYLEAFQVNRKD